MWKDEKEAKEALTFFQEANDVPEEHEEVPPPGVSQGKAQLEPMSARSQKEVSGQAASWAEAGRGGDTGMADTFEIAVVSPNEKDDQTKVIFKNTCHNMEWLAAYLHASS